MLRGLGQAVAVCVNGMMVCFCLCLRQYVSVCARALAGVNISDCVGDSESVSCVCVYACLSAGREINVAAQLA
jgi:hypothetical protein